MSTNEQIIGKTPVSIDQTEDRIDMRFSDGSSARWWHRQNCCETVEIEGVVGDWRDLIGHPLLVAEERISTDHVGSDDYGSNTWTFYAFRSIGGSVDVRWHGSSNGFYSESVDFDFKAAIDAPVMLEQDGGHL